MPRWAWALSLCVFFAGCANHYEIKATFRNSRLVPTAEIETQIDGYSKIRDTASVYERVLKFLNNEFFKPSKEDKQ